MSLILFGEELQCDDNHDFNIIYYTCLGKSNINFHPVLVAKNIKDINKCYIHAGHWWLTQACPWDSCTVYRYVQACRKLYENKQITSAVDIFLEHFKDQYEKYSIFE